MKKFRPRFSSNLDTPEFYQLKDKIEQLGVIKSLSILESGKEVEKSKIELLKKSLMKEENTIEGLALKFQVSASEVENYLGILKNQGYNIISNGNILSISKILAKSEKPTIIESNEVRDTYTYKFGVTGDNHLGSTYERLDVLYALYDYFERKGVKHVFNTGNWIEGEHDRFNKYIIHKRGIDGQIDYMLDVWPRKEGMKTLYVAGDDHEGWYVQKFGIDVGKYLALRAADPEHPHHRTDLEYLGYMEHDVMLEAPKGNTVIRVQHPGGGSSYAHSYAPQKIVESLQGGEKPHILLLGHYHKASYNFIRNIHVLQTGCTQDQTPFMRKLKLSAHVGGWYFEVSTDIYGTVTKFSSEFLPFFDKDLYKNRWKYKMA